MVYYINSYDTSGEREGRGYVGKEGDYVTANNRASVYEDASTLNSIP